MPQHLQQQEPQPRYGKIDPQFFINNRARLAAMLPPGALVIVHAADIMPKSGDGQLPFKQDSDFFYLTGIDQEEGIFVLFPDAKTRQQREILFTKRTNAKIAIWEGAKYSQEGAKVCSGIASVQWLEIFDQTLHQLMGEAEHVYLASNEHSRAVVEVETRNARFARKCKEQFPLHSYRRLAPLMAQLRIVKQEQEITLLRKACQITHEAFMEMLLHVHAGVMEYALEASLLHSMVRRGSRGFAYTPIVAAGANSCVLHYIANSLSCQPGDLILLDVGAEYANYSADMTRTVPVDGRFTKRQREVYDAVLAVMQEAKKLLMPGATLPQYHQEVGKLMEEQLLQLGLLTSKEVRDAPLSRPAYKKYFMHGTSHHLGLDTHDVGHAHQPLAEGMVLTVEPGIYIPEEGIGIRLEDDVVIREGGLENLLARTPLTAQEIEEAMQEI
jgi:Xaa-Pro aminopeptidase